jgi:hypothetical protein
MTADCACLATHIDKSCFDPWAIKRIADNEIPPLKKIMALAST